MVELTVGSRFWYDGKLCEVVINNDCKGCVFLGKGKKCWKSRCIPRHRHDEKSVCFREVKE